jgi:hypothetical protein
MHREDLKEIGILEDLHIDWRIIFKWVLNKYFKVEIY